MSKINMNSLKRLEDYCHAKGKKFLHSFDSTDCKALMIRLGDAIADDAVADEPIAHEAPIKTKKDSKKEGPIKATDEECPPGVPKVDSRITAHDDSLRNNSPLSTDTKCGPLTVTPPGSANSVTFELDRVKGTKWQISIQGANKDNWQVGNCDYYSRVTHDPPPEGPFASCLYRETQGRTETLSIAQFSICQVDYASIGDSRPDLLNDSCTVQTSETPLNPPQTFKYTGGFDAARLLTGNTQTTLCHNGTLPTDEYGVTDFFTGELLEKGSTAIYVDKRHGKCWASYEKTLKPLEDPASQSSPLSGH
jgi:hypothetical protein